MSIFCLKSSLLKLCYSYSERKFLVSNETPEQPVVSPVSGCIYERRLIEKYLTENGVDPMNGEKLEAEQLVEVKCKCLLFRNVSLN